MNTEPDLGPHLRRRLTYLFKRSLLSLDELHEKHLASSGINVRELGVLLLLDDREPGSQQQAAERLGVDRTSMVALLDGLEAKSLVVRRADAADRRRNVVEITDTGRATLKQATRASDEAERELLSVLDDADAARLRELLDQVVARKPHDS